MKQTLFIILFFWILNLFGQKSEFENFINQIINYEVPENFEYYYLIPKSLEQPKIYDSINNYHIEEFRTTDKGLIQNLFYQNSINEIDVDWSEYDLKNAKFIISETHHPITSPPTAKNVEFVKYNISDEKFDSIFTNKKPHTIIVKKKWYWNKKRIWENNKFRRELKKAWEKDEKECIEEKYYFQFSKPIFSANGKYARISVSTNGRCKGIVFTAIYKKDNGIWKKLLEYNTDGYTKGMSHARCGDILFYIE